MAKTIESILGRSKTITNNEVLNEQELSSKEGTTFQTYQKPIILINYVAL